MFNDVIIYRKLGRGDGTGTTATSATTIQYSKKKLMFAHSKVLRCHVLTNSSVLSCLRRLAADGDVSRRSGTADCSRSLDPRRRNREAHGGRSESVERRGRSERQNAEAILTASIRRQPGQVLASIMLNRSIFCHSRRR